MLAEGSGAWEVLRQEFSDLPDGGQVLRLLLRLLLAIVLGGLLGYQREREGKPAGLRTHMLVTLAAALLVLVPQMAGMGPAEVSRIIQGLLAGIGFIGGGAILKLSQKETVHGLTTAAGILMAAAIGVATGLGRLVSALLATLATFLILSQLHRLERRICGKGNKRS